MTYEPSAESLEVEGLDPTPHPADVDLKAEAALAADPTLAPSSTEPSPSGSALTAHALAVTSPVAVPGHGLTHNGTDTPIFLISDPVDPMTGMRLASDWETA